MTSLTAENDTPLYQQLKSSLMHSIQNGDYPTGGKIPTETELSDKYQVSRITVRRAVSELCKMGLLVRKQGKGTFVKNKKLVKKIDFMMGFSESCRAMNMKPSFKLLKCEKEILNDEDAKAMSLPSGSQGIVTGRLNFADKTPIMVENNIFPSPKYDFLLKENLKSSLYTLLWEKYGIYARYTKNTYLDVTRAAGDISKLLKISIGDPVFYLFENVYDSEGDLIYIGKQYFVGDLYRFNIQNFDRGPSPSPVKKTKK